MRYRSRSGLGFPRLSPIPYLILRQLFLSRRRVRVDSFTRVPTNVTLPVHSVLVVPIMSLGQWVVGAEMQVLRFDFGRELVAGAGYNLVRRCRVFVPLDVMENSQHWEEMGLGLRIEDGE